MGPYVVDFVCVESGLVVELDGGQHMERREHDQLRTAYLSRLGLRVRRYWNNQVIEDMEAVLADVLIALRDGGA